MQEDERGMRFQIEDLTCSSCAGDMENILQETEGILYASVNFADETVYVKYSSTILDRKQVFSAVRKLGYSARIIRET